MGVDLTVVLAWGVFIPEKLWQEFLEFQETAELPVKKRKKNQSKSVVVRTDNDTDKSETSSKKDAIKSESSSSTSLVLSSSSSSSTSTSSSSSSSSKSKKRKKQERMSTADFCEYLFYHQVCDGTIYNNKALSCLQQGHYGGPNSADNVFLYITRDSQIIADICRVGKEFVTGGAGSDFAIQTNASYDDENETENRRKELIGLLKMESEESLKLLAAFLEQYWIDHEGDQENLLGKWLVGFYH